MKHKHKWVGNFIWKCKCGRITKSIWICNCGEATYKNPFWKRRIGKSKKVSIKEMRTLFKQCR